MSILKISRDWGVDPSIVRITSTDNLATITTNGYLTTQESTIEAINNGPFEWAISDTVLIYYSDGQGFFTRNIVDNTFTAFPSSPGSLPSTLEDGYIFVGNSSNIATGVEPSGVISLTNTGVFSIVDGSIVNADIANETIVLDKLAPITAAAIVHGDGAGNVTDNNVGGDLSMNSLAQFTILPDAVGTAKLADGAVTSVKTASNLVQYARISLSNAQFLGMYATPVSIISSGGANTAIIIDEFVLQTVYGSTQSAAGGAVALQYGNTVHGGGPLATATIAAATLNGDSASSLNSAVGSNADTALSAAVNTAVYISNQTAAFTTGNSTYFVHVWYRIVATS